MLKQFTHLINACQVTCSLPDNRPKNKRYTRFAKFASVQNDNNLFMTPTDFVESLVSQSTSQEKIEINDYSLQFDQERFKQKVQNCSTSIKNDAGVKIFKSFSKDGLISYHDYAFLLAILTKHEHYFHIAFKVLDVDFSGYLEETEYSELERCSSKSKISIENTEHLKVPNVSKETI